ncbi:MMPL family transporter [Rothia dentocariosa]|uniref:MMPL family transporter n=2 Tax=Rothia TaxID=32207 RepID=UPI001FD06D18|nr:MMPL family transporter [Rothia dentocariosa]
MSKKAWASVNTPEKITAHHAEKEKREATPHGWLRIVLAKPVVTILLCVAALGAIAIPMGQMRMGLPSAESSPVESTEYQAYQIVKDKFGEGLSGPVVAVAHTPAGMTDAQVEQAQVDIARAIQAKDPENVKTAVPMGQTDDHTLQIFQVIPKHGPSSVETVNLVEQLRQVDVNVQGTDVRLGVTGLTGGNIDISNTLAQKLPLYLAVVMGLSFIVLILVFRSILVPLVASIGFLFSILASFGAVVAVYQMGFMGSLFGVHDPGPILAFLPTLMIGILFGLAMDYQVFLVSGMREAYVHGKDAKTAVVAGYNHAVRVVVAAMIIMISVFGGFIFAESSMIRPIGFGLAFGVLVDAFVVRMTITPAIMSLLGEKAWWMPKWLDKLVPNMDVEGATLLEELEHKDSTKTSGIADLTSDIDASNIETPWAKKKTE